MKDARIMMGMTITIEVVDHTVIKRDIEDMFDYFKAVDEQFSTYKETSEITAINKKNLPFEQYSKKMKEVFVLSEQTRRETGGYFDIKKPDNSYDPSGLVKGWCLHNVACLLREKGFKHFLVDAGGDTEISGFNAEEKKWAIGIRNPFNPEKKIIKVVYLSDKGIATSGTYARGQHIYNPLQSGQLLEDVVSLTVIGPNIYESDRFATAGFAMGRRGIEFIDSLPDLEGYMVDAKGVATMTQMFGNYTQY